MSSARMRHPRNRSTRSSRQVLSSDSKALVISGGAAHGAFAVGAVDILLNKKNLDYDTFVGTSTGALVCSLAIINEVPALIEIYENVSTHEIIEENSLFSLLINADGFSDGFHRSKPLKELIDEKLTFDRFKAIMASDKTLIFTTVNLNTGNLEYWSTKPVKRNVLSGKVNVFKNDQDSLKDEHVIFKNALLASSSIPIFMNTIQIRQGGDRYTDGGLREIAGVEVAIELGASDVYAILMSPAEDEIPRDSNKKTNILDVALRSYDIVAREIARSDVAIGELYKQMNGYIREVEGLYRLAQQQSRILLTETDYKRIFPDNALKDIDNPLRSSSAFNRFIVIRPNKANDTLLEGSSLDFKPEIMKKNLAKGRKEADKIPA